MKLLLTLIFLICLGCADQYEGGKESEQTSYSIVAADPTLGIAKPHHHYSPWDLNDDGIVNIFDLIIVANHFGEEVRFYTVITRVIDGDTAVTEVGDKIRYLGIDTPERGEPFYNEATIFNRGLVEGKRVRLEFERDEVDGFGRVLAYLFADDDRMVNEEMVLFGLAVLFNDAKGLKHQERLKNSLVRAQDARIFPSGDGRYISFCRCRRFRSCLQHNPYAFRKIQSSWAKWITKRSPYITTCRLNGQ